MTRKPRIPGVDCAENITLNHLLHAVPEPPQQKPIKSFRGSEEGHILSFSKERDLVEILAFLAKTDDGSDHIPAVCVEQDPDGTALKALLAINKRTHTDGNVLLQSLKVQFEKIFSVLRRSLYERGSSTKITKQLLETIVQMCSFRITCRLRLTGKKMKEEKASIKDILQKAMEGIQQINPQKLHSLNLGESLSAFRERSKRVIQAINEWYNHRIRSRLNDIVEKMDELSNVNGLQQLLHLIPSGPKRMIKESAFANTLLDIIRKVYRYKQAARILHRIAKKFPIVRNIEIHLATLPEKACDRLHNPAYSLSLPEALTRLGKINGKKYNISQISRFIKCDKTKSPSDHFSQKTNKTLREAKIHAEIQLIAYCELQSPSLFPRAISSSKDACFLCHLFIQTHGKTVSASTISGVQDPVDIATESTVPVVSAYPGSRVAETVNSPVFALEKKKLSSCVLAPNDMFTGVIIPTASSPLFIADSLHIHLEMEESSKPESASKRLAYSIERINVNQATKIPVEFLMVDVVELDGEMTYSLPASRAFCLTAHDTAVKVVCKQK